MKARHEYIPSVMALVPTWNAAEFIERTLRSLADQTYHNFRVLISDDASTDNTAELCERFVVSDSRFSLIRQPRNLGWVMNTNVLLDAAKADYLLFAFHDDVLLPSYISRCVDALESNPAAIIAHSDIITHYQSEKSEIRQYTALEGMKSRLERAKLVLYMPNHWSTPNRGVFRAEAAKHIGGLKRHLGGEFSADWPWLVHMALLGESIRIPEILVEKYYQKNSLSRGWNFSPRHQIAVLLSCAREISLANITVYESLRLYATLLRRCTRLIRQIGTEEVRVPG